jgi:hypothetical protein
MLIFRVQINDEASAVHVNVGVGVILNLNPYRVLRSAQQMSFIRRTERTFATPDNDISQYRIHRERERDHAQPEQL